MKKAGIVCDNYKVEKFKKDLIDNGFTDFEVTPLDGKLKNCTNIAVNIDELPDTMVKLMKLVGEMNKKHSSKHHLN